MSNKHPITPPPELIVKWASSMCGYYEAAQWGADQELEACVELVPEYCPYFGDYPLPEDKLRAAGLEVKVQRRISKLIELEKETEVPDATGLVVKQQVERFRREPLADGASVKSGDRIEVELILESKNDYEYLIFSDAKAAGFEALDALSGYISGGGFSAYMEPRDQTMDFFIRALPRGTHTLRYQLRAETPGTYKALPAEASAMYAPELRGNSDDIKLLITEP